MSNLEPGQWVLGRYRSGEYFFPGVVQHVGPDGAVTIAYDDGDRETLPLERVKPYDWTVGSQVEAIWSGDGSYYEAVIIAAAPNGADLVVRFDDGIEESLATARCRSR